MPPPPPVRALWVTRFEYSSPQEVRQIIHTASSAGFTDLFFQIRGYGTVFYKSQLEPWAAELSGKTDLDPDWDPLKIACKEAGKTGLRLHAYMNVLPGWKGRLSPSPTNQLWSTHRDWFMVDALGKTMKPPPGWYSFLNPLLPEVQNHLQGIIKELSAYSIAGIHLDYIRYPYDYKLFVSRAYPQASPKELQKHAQFSFDPATKKKILEKYGNTPTKEQLAQFRRSTIRQLIQQLQKPLQIHQESPLILSASILGDPNEAKRFAGQDPAAWLRDQNIDWVVQMNYSPTRFSQRIKLLKKEVGQRAFRRSVIIGINAGNSLQDFSKELQEVETARARGFAIFSYSQLFTPQGTLTKKGRILLTRIQPSFSTSGSFIQEPLDPE